MSLYLFETQQRFFDFLLTLISIKIELELYADIGKSLTILFFNEKESLILFANINDSIQWINLRLQWTAAASPDSGCIHGQRLQPRTVAAAPGSDCSPLSKNSPVL